MNISDIPYPKVKALAEKYAADPSYREGYTGPIHNTAVLEHAFRWDLTEEGHSFWNYIHAGVYSMAVRTCPELFTEDKPVVAYLYEIAKFYHATTGEYTGWAQQVSFEKPPMGPGFRNLVELVAR